MVGILPSFWGKDVRQTLGVSRRMNCFCHHTYQGQNVPDYPLSIRTPIDSFHGYCFRV